MKFSPSRINAFLLFKLPAAFFCGVRVRQLTDKVCTTAVRLRWINQNPFRSMFWAVQGMAAELSTGVLIMQAVQGSGAAVSTLVVNNEGRFLKKARGKIRFECREAPKVERAVREAVESGEPVVCELKSVGTDQQGYIVSEFVFAWSLKLKTS